MRDALGELGAAALVERVEFLASRKSSDGQASNEASPDQPASDGVAREAPQAA